jgi:ATP synthase protein I
MKSLRAVALPVLVVTLVCVVVAAVVGGGDSAVGALIGGLLVAIFLSSNTSILETTTKANPQMALLIALTLFSGKVAVMLVLLAVFLNSDTVADHIDSKALGITLLVTSLLSTVLQIVAYRNQRVPTYDLGNSD